MKREALGYGLPMPGVIRPKALRLPPISVVQRMRLTSSDEVIRVAEQVTRLVTRLTPQLTER